METNEARPWFLKRWIVNPLTTIDSKIFDKHVTGPYLSSGLVVYSATITFIVVMGIALISTIWAKKKHTRDSPRHRSVHCCTLQHLLYRAASAPELHRNDCHKCKGLAHAVCALPGGSRNHSRHYAHQYCGICLSGRVDIVGRIPIHKSRIWKFS